MGNVDVESQAAAIPTEIARIVASSDLHSSLRCEDLTAWDRTLAELPYVPVVYTSASIDYQLVYQRGVAAGEWWDISLILYNDNRPCGVWPLSFAKTPAGTLVTSHGMPVAQPLLVRGLSARLRKSLMKSCFDLLDALCRTQHVTNWESVESFSGGPEQGFGPWHQEHMIRGSRIQVRHELFVDLSLDLREIKTHFRKSYKPLITAGMRLWQVGVLTTIDAAIWDEFRELHLRIAGRVTRSPESWVVHHRAVADGNAMLVYLRNDRSEMIGAGFFNFTRDEAVYSVGAYDRSLFAKPLGHLVQYRAIEELKQRGVRWYKIGWRPYPNDVPAPDEKEMSIGAFKQGFATHIFPQYLLRYQVTVAEADRALMFDDEP